MVKMHKLESYADLMTLADFKEQVRLHNLISYDGSGYFATETEVSDISAPCSVAGLSSNLVPSWATHVAWYNR